MTCSRVPLSIAKINPRDFFMWCGGFADTKLFWNEFFDVSTGI